LPKDMVDSGIIILTTYICLLLWEVIETLRALALDLYGFQTQFYS